MDDAFGFPVIQADEDLLRNEEAFLEQCYNLAEAKDCGAVKVHYGFTQ